MADGDTYFICAIFGLGRFQYCELDCCHELTNKKYSPGGPKVDWRGAKVSDLQDLAIYLRWVIQTGLEPVTYCLEGSCSIQLSY